MVRRVAIACILLGGLALLGASQIAPSRSVDIAAVPTAEPSARSDAATPLPAAPAPSAPALPPPPPTPRDALQAGVLIVISLPSQKMFVFRDGQVWGASPVSTGRRGHATPTGVFTILQKKVRHRSNLYSNAPMPYMQRLTWGGIALHAGYLPGYPASHGCIRMPAAFARKLYGVTNPATASVLISDRPLAAFGEAYTLVSGEPAPPALAADPFPEELPPGAAQGGRVQTIQLAAAASPENAAGLWQQLVVRRPELRRLDHRVVAATVNSARVFRLRATGPEAHAICTRLKSAGIACMPVSG
jgi:hypothetical protein